MIFKFLFLFYFFKNVSTKILKYAATLKEFYGKNPLYPAIITLQCYLITSLSIYLYFHLLTHRFDRFQSRLNVYSR